MSAPSQSQAPVPENKPQDKELNFRNLEARYEKQLQQERAARLDAERIAQELSARKNQVVEEEDDSEPYVDHKKLEKKLAKFGEQSQKLTQNEIQKAVQTALKDERKSNWLKANSDFYEILEHAEKLAAQDPELAESILEMPEGFERQKLVYKNIKALGLHKPAVREQTIQEKVDANRRGPYYQPTNMASAPYAGQASDYSAVGQKNAYEQMQQLKKRLGV